MPVVQVDVYGTQYDVRVSDDATVGELRGRIGHDAGLEDGTFVIEAEGAPLHDDTSKLQSLLGGDTPVHITASAKAFATLRLSELGVSVLEYPHTLHTACRAGDVECVRLIIAATQGTDAVPPAGCLVSAAAMGHEVVVRILLEEAGADPNAQAPQAHGWTAMQRAAAADHVAVMRLLRSHSADAAIQDSEGMRALHHTARHGSINALLLLREWGADIIAADTKQRNILHHAASNGQPQYLRAALADPAVLGLLESRCNVGDLQSRTPLHMACVGKRGRLAHDGDGAMREGQTEAVRVLLEHGAAVCPQDHEGRTPFLVAAVEMCGAKMAILEQHGADIDACCHAGRAAIHIAAQRRDVDMMQRLRMWDADPTLEDSSGWSALTHAVSLGCTAGMLVLKGWLQDRGWTAVDAVRPAPEVCSRKTVLHFAAEFGSGEGLHFLHAWLTETLPPRGTELRRALDSRDAHGNTPLLFACSSANVSTMLQLLEWGADPNAANHRGKTPLHSAAALSRVDMAKALVQLWGSNANASSAAGETPLFEAVRSGCVSTVAALLDCGADVFHESLVRATPLHTCAGYRQPGILQVLRGRGAVVDARDAEGRTPLHKAASLNDMPSASLLVRWGADPHAKDDAGVSPYDEARQKSFTALVSLFRSGKGGESACDEDASSAKKGRKKPQQKVAP